MIITNAIITAYCACQLCCGTNASGLAANGKPPIQGVTIAASRKIPLGTPVLIGTNRFIVQDRLAKRFDSRFDIFFNNHAEAKRFGKKTLTVTILSKKK